MAVFEVVSNKKVAQGVFRMDVCGAVGALRPGSFVEVAVPGCYLRRPFSVADASDGAFSLIYKVVGKGTAAMSAMGKGSALDILTGLGNGFDVGKVQKRALLIGGGLGVAPLYYLSKILKNKDIHTVLCAGFNTAADIFLRDEYEKNCDEVRYATIDGSCGARGFVTEQLADIECDCFYACGPVPMLKAVSGMVGAPGQLSLEARMGCGFGVCMGCTIETTAGPKRVCKEGPVFEKEELVW